MWKSWNDMEKIDMKGKQKGSISVRYRIPPRTEMYLTSSNMADGFDSLIWCGRTVGCPEAVVLETER